MTRKFFNELQTHHTSMVRQQKGVILQVLDGRGQGIPQGLKPAFVAALSAKAKALAYLEAKAEALALEAKAEALALACKDAAVCGALR